MSKEEGANIGEKKEQKKVKVAPLGFIDYISETKVGGRQESR